MPGYLDASSTSQESSEPWEYNIGSYGVGALEGYNSMYRLTGEAEGQLYRRCSLADSTIGRWENAMPEQRWILLDQKRDSFFGRWHNGRISLPMKKMELYVNVVVNN